MRRKIPYLCLCAFLWVILMETSEAFGSAASVECYPSNLERTLFCPKFHNLTLSGTGPEGAHIILKIVSPDKEFRLNKSGKGLGFIWLPVSHAEVKKIPGMYALLSSAKISEILPREEQEAAGLGSDFGEIYRTAQVHFKDPPKAEEAESMSREFISGLIRILQEGGLYQVQEGAVDVSRGNFRARLMQPAEAPVGEYHIFCYAVKEGKAQLLDQKNFRVQSTGVVEWLAQAARTNAVVYGILAALMAAGVGILVGFIFRKGGRH